MGRKFLESPERIQLKTDHQPVLSFMGVSVTYDTQEGVIPAVQNASFDVRRGEVVALVGESGSGKTTIALASAGLLGSTAKVFGKITVGGIDLVEASEPEIRALRGKYVGFVFQDPLASLNPLLTIGTQISEVAQLHQGLNARSATRVAVELLNQVRISSPRERLRSYPHELSGGMRQRALLAAALAGDPQLLIADEPTTALDVTVQAEILDLIRTVCRERSLGVLFITHDLGVASVISDRIVVMYGGEIVEEGDTMDIFQNPRMPYTAALINSHPSHAINFHANLSTIPGEPPTLGVAIRGCRFAPRCTCSREICKNRHPSLNPRGAHERRARCFGTEPIEGWIT